MTYLVMRKTPVTKEQGTMQILIIINFLMAWALAEKARFDNYRVYSVLPQNERQLKVLRILEQENDYNFWTSARSLKVPVDIMVPPHMRDEFSDFLDENHLDSNIKIENVQSLIDIQESATRSGSNSMDWTSYHRLEEIYKWLKELSEKYPENVKVVVGGSTYEGREIRGIQITFGNNLTGVLMESGIHAREWIGPAATTWMINQILSGEADPIFKRFNYLYFPSVNPDGYVHTWKHNRLWRKTRSPNKLGFKTCYGADPNRNWDFHWNEIGSSEDPCSETYAGKSPFSEIEMRSFSDYLKRVSRKLNQKIFLSFHSYSQLILYPWGYTTEPARNEKIFSKVGQAAAKALKDVHGEEFEVGSIATTIYPTSGTSIEWYYNEFNGTLVFTYELRDKGKYGFVLPPEFIVPVGEETLASMKTILSEYEKLPN